MLTKHMAASIFSAGLNALAASGVIAQDYPNKPIRIIAGGAGGGNDFTARLIAQGISGPLGQPVTVENRGGNQQVSVATVPADGYTLFVSGSSLWLSTLMKKMSYDTLRDFAPVSLASRTPNVLVVHPSVPAKSVKELIAFAKTRPGELNYGAGAPGGSNHLAGELLKSLAGINIVAIPYASISQQTADLVSGQTQIMIDSPAQVMGQIKAGKLRALAVTSVEASPLAPGLPTVAATVPGYEADTSYGVLGPAKMPVAVINRLHQEIVRVLTTPSSKERLFNAGLDTVASSPEQYAATIRSEITRWSKVISESGIKAE